MEPNDRAIIDQLMKEIACIRTESQKRLANIDGEITYMSKVMERLDDALPIIITNDANLKTIKERQDACPIGDLKDRLKGLEKDTAYLKWAVCAFIGFLGYIQKQALWAWLQRTFS